MRSDSELTSGRERAAPQPGLATATFMDHRPLVVLAGLLLFTLALAWPMVAWESDATASQSPVTEITRTQELIDERFADDVFRYFLLIEATGGNMLDRAPLLRLLENTRAMRADPAVRSYLVDLRDPNLGIDAIGVWTIADSVDRLLREAGVGEGIAGATEQQIDDSVGLLLTQGSPADWGLATQAEQDAAGTWRSPALFALVATDNEMLGGGGFLVAIGTDDLAKERFARTLRDALEGGGDELAVWAPAADVNLTSNEQGELAGPFIGLTIAVVLLIVGVAFRSYWTVAVAGLALAMLMIWLRGGANLIGLKNDQILNTILPISMISFGIDSAFHGISRVREERRRGLGARRAFVVGLGSVFGALALAASSDAAAFLSNTSAGIESVVQFGLAAALATVAAFVLLGMGTPLLLAVIEDRTGGAPISRFGRRGEMAFSLLAAALATGAVMVLLFVSAAIGLGLLALYLVLALVVPFFLARRREHVAAVVGGAGRASRRLGRLVAGSAVRPWLTLGMATAVTAVALWAALQLEVTFDVKDFFSPESDFVVALDKTADYLGEQGGEPAVVYVETDLTSPDALAALRSFTIRVAATEGGPLAREADGRIRVNPGVLGLLADLGDDVESGGSAAVQDAFATSLRDGISAADGTVLWTPNSVGTVLWRDGSTYATVLTYQIPDTRQQTNVVATRELLEPIAEDLESSLRSIDSESVVVVTGSAVYRDDQLAGIRRSLLLALPIAVLACFGVAAGFMRSIRYAAVAIIPILLVVIWLFGIMHQAGYSINVVTAIIAAVSIGIGIDFSTHFAMRFLEERRRGAVKHAAIVAAGAGTGTALTGSALTSVAGFGILAFAPMPMFATYGLLTALMILLALAASLLVLPSLLVVVSRGESEIPGHRVAGRVVDLRSGQDPAIRLGLSRDLSDGIVDHVLVALEEPLRRGDVTVRTVPGAAVPGLVADGTMDLALMTRWPISTASIGPELETISLAREELLAVGGPTGAPGDPADRDALTRGLLVAGPTPEAEDGVTRLLSGKAQVPILAHTVADVLTGLRLAKITGGAMVLPRSMTELAGLPVRSLNPPAYVETVLLATSQRSADADVFAVVVALSDAWMDDEALESAESAKS
jgi:predicted RND superfamily exporter protein